MTIKDLASDKYIIYFVVDTDTGELLYVAKDRKTNQIYRLMDLLLHCIAHSDLVTKTKNTRQKQGMYFENRDNKALAKSLLEDAINTEQKLDILLERIGKNQEMPLPMTTNVIIINLDAAPEPTAD
jgi:hypothetical protein